MANKKQTTVVVGAGQAGFSFSAKLRELGYEGNIILLSGESLPPYQRPPLSKAYLLGEMSLERLMLRPASFYDDQNIDLRLSVRAEKIFPEQKTLQLSDGKTLSWDTLILATGSYPRPLPDTMTKDLAGLYYVRAVHDADAMAKAFNSGKHVLVIGGGYVGLEAAAVAAKQGLKVTLIEAAERILQRVACKQTSDFFRQLHQSNGVDIREQTGIEELIGTDGNVTTAKLSDGTTLEIDFALAGIGILPHDELAVDCGLATQNGIVVDEFCQTSDKDILAIGDCANFPFNDQRLRLESVGHAIDHGQAAAGVVMGSNKPYQAKPWFWSDQYDTKMQIVGISTGYDRVIVRKSKPGSVSHWYFSGDKLLAVDAMNDPRAYMVAKRLIDAGRTASQDIVADSNTDLKTLLTG